MTQQLRNRLDGILAGPLAVVIGLRGDPQAPIPFDLKRLRVSAPIANQFREGGRIHSRDLGEADELAFAPGYHPGPNEVLELPIAQFDYPGLIAAILNPNVMPAYDPDEDTKVAFHCFVAIHNHEAAAFLRRTSRVSIARRGWIAGVLTEGQIVGLDSHVLTFAPAVDIVFEADRLWVSNVAAYRALFRDTQALQAHVTANIQAITQHVQIANVADFEADCQRNPYMMAKLQEVAQKTYLPLLTPAVLAQVIQRYNLPATLLNAAGQLVHDATPNLRWKVLQLLDDDFLESIATTEHYAVNSKYEI